MKRAPKIILAIIVFLLILFLLYNCGIHKTAVAELSLRDRIFFSELFKQKNSILDSRIEGDVVVYVRGEVKGKTFESKYSPNDDIFGFLHCGVLPDDLMILLRKNYPNISSESYSIKFSNKNKSYAWISIHKWISDDQLLIIVGNSGIKSGTRSSLYEMSKVEGKWVGNLISVKMS